jgi:acetate kinase
LDLAGMTLILALNPGSSSLKAAVRDPARLLEIDIDRLGSDRASITVDGDRRGFDGDLSSAVSAIAEELDQRGLRPQAVTHRVVHGGPDHFAPTLIDDRLVAELQLVVPLARLHLPGDLDSIGRARSVWPDVAHIACFDTGFHHDLPLRSQRLPVPAELVAAGIRRYGFHGLSVQSVLDSRPDLGGVVIAHLGSGCSVTAVQDGQPRHTTMSLTPTGGMVSATRSGDLDPEIVLYLLQERDFAVDHVRTLLDRASGIAGITGGPHDLRDLGAGPLDQLAIDIFVGSAAMAIAGCATTLDRWDTLVFTGGVGEHDEQLRQQVCRQLTVVRGSRTAEPTAEVPGISVLTVAADEAAVMDRLARELLERLAIS